MQQSEMGSSYYQYHQPHLPTPSPNPNSNFSSTPADPQFNPVSNPSYASAPPVSSGYSSSDYSNYLSSYPSYAQTTDYGLNSPAPYPPNPAAQLPNPSHPPSYSFPHLESQSSQPSAYYPYDQTQPASNYDYLTPTVPYSSPAPAAHSSSPYGASGLIQHQNSLDRTPSYGGYGDQGIYDSGVYKYNGKKVEPYGGSGGRTAAAGEVMFDDYGRPINVHSGDRPQARSQNFPKIVKAAPKVEDQQDVKSGVLKFRVKLLSEGSGQTDMDVLCQIGLDGIRILEPSSGRTLKIYPLETVTRWEVLDSYIFAFWAKTSVDVEARRIRLKSNSYTTNNILDAVTAASIQVKEMGASNKTIDSVKSSEQLAEKKKGFADWMKLMKPMNEEKDHWVPDEAVTKCTYCGTDFNAFVRRHHCRNCGDIFCDKCTQGRIALTADENAQPVRVCDRCMAEVTQRLSNTRESALRVTGIQSHEDLAKKLQEEMDRNRKASSGRDSKASGTRMREVACPTCTVHLQVNVPASGSETIECSVCQHPFLVSAH